MSIIKTFGNLFANRIDRRADATNQQHILGQGGNDTLYGADLDDTLDGGTGRDSMIGGLGSDLYIVDNVNDSVIEEADGGPYARDTIETTVSIDLTTMASRFQHVEDLRVSSKVRTSTAIALGGNAADNLLTGHAGVDTLKGYAGDDTLIGLAGNDSLDGGDGHDRLEGGAGQDLLVGGAGNDTLQGGGGRDSLIGGSGNDVYLLEAGTAQITETANGGTDLIVSSTSVDMAGFSQVENLYLDGTGLKGMGNGLDNDIFSVGTGNLVEGGAGHDTLRAVSASSTLLGGAGNDLLKGENSLLDGGEGNDTLSPNSSLSSERYRFAGQFGQDTIQEESAYGLPSTLIGTDVAEFAGIDYRQLWLSHNANGDLLIKQIGTQNSVTLSAWSSGTGRVEAIEAQDGSATRTLETRNIELLAQVMDQLAIPASSLQELPLSARNLIDQLWQGVATDTTLTFIGGAGNDVLTGYDSADVLIGNDGQDTLAGAGGRDTLRGGLGNDTYVVDNTDTVIEESAEGGHDLVRSAVDFDLRNVAHVENVSLYNNASRAWGNAGANQLEASSGLCTLDGGAGDDTLLSQVGGNCTMIGGAGNDTLRTTNWGNDTYRFEAGFGQDTIQDFAGGDTVDFTSIRSDQLWFSLDSSNTLLVQVLGSDDHLRVQGWEASYGGNARNGFIETWQAVGPQGSTTSIGQNQVDALVSIMGSLQQPAQFNQLSDTDQARIRAVWGG
jgi:Ca2+-binding RTX toxin-like protein